MDNLQLFETEPPTCCTCGNPFNLSFWCLNCHYVCSLCQRTYKSSCPICCEPYCLPQDESNEDLLQSLLQPDNSALDVNYDLNFIDRNVSLRSLTKFERGGLKKKSPVEKCKEHFFLAVWDSLASMVFSNCSSRKQGKGKKSMTIADSISKILSRVTRKMGKSAYDCVVASYQDKKTIHVSLGLFMLLIGSQFILQRIKKS